MEALEKYDRYPYFYQAASVCLSPKRVILRVVQGDKNVTLVLRFELVVAGCDPPQVYRGLAVLRPAIITSCLLLKFFSAFMPLACA